MGRAFNYDGRARRVSGRAFQQSWSTVTMIDSFEDGDLSEYEDDLAEFSVVDESTVTPNAIDGSKILHAPADTYSTIYSTSGLANYFAKGSEANAHVRMNAESRSGFMFGLGVGTSDCYAVDVSVTSNDLRLRDRAAGSTLAADYSPGLVADTWYRVNVVWDDGTLGGSDNDITVKLFDMTDTQVGATLTANDSSHAAKNGIGWIGAGPGDNESWFDYAYIV